MSDNAMTAPARALQGAGNAMQDVGDQFAKVQNAFQEDERKSVLAKTSADFDVELQQSEEQARQSEDSDGYATRAQSRYQELAKKYENSLTDPVARERFQNYSESVRPGFMADAGKFEATGRIAKINDNLSKALTGFGQTVQADPNNYEKALKQGNAAIDALKDRLTPEQTIQLRGDFEKSLQATRIKSIADRDPNAAVADMGGGEPSGDGAVGVVVDKIIGVESGGNPNAKNPNSSASGVGQFIDSTWLATVKKYRPDLAEGKSDEQILALKGDKALGREMTTRYTQENADTLSSAGLPVTPGTLYLAHFAGSGGAEAVLKAPDGASVESILGSQVVAANGFLKGKTVGWLKEWASKKMGGPSGPNTAGNGFYSRLSPDEVALIYNKARDGADADNAQKYADLKGQMSLRAAQRELTVDQVMASPLNSADKAALVNKVRDDDKWGAEASALNRGVDGGGSVPLNIFDADERAIGDKAFDTRVKGVASAAQYTEMAEGWTAATGYIPKSLSATMRQGALATDPGRLSSAMALADKIETSAPGAFSQMQGGDDLRDKLARYRGLLDRGMTGEQAAQDMLSEEKPDRKATREQLKTGAGKFVKDLTLADLTNSFDGWLSSEPGAGVTVPERGAALAEFRSIAEDEYYATGGDPAQAKQRAIMEMRKVWGVSSVSGSKQLMRLPPENFYPKMDGSWDYLHDDAQKAAEAFVKDEHPDREVTGVSIVADRQTRQEIGLGQPPKYRLLYTYKNADGFTLSDEVTSGRWGFKAEDISKMNHDRFMSESIEERAFQTNRDDINERARKAGEETPGPAWMKAQQEMRVHELEEHQ